MAGTLGPGAPGCTRGGPPFLGPPVAVGPSPPWKSGAGGPSLCGHTLGSGSPAAALPLRAQGSLCRPKSRPRPPCTPSPHDSPAQSGSRPSPRLGSQAAARPGAPAPLWGRCRQCGGASPGVPAVVLSAPRPPACPQPPRRQGPSLLLFEGHVSCGDLALPDV